MRERVGHYRFFAHPGKFIPRETVRAGTEVLKPYVAEYAQRLVEVTKQYSFQWFNIYPFWDEPPAVWNSTAILGGNDYGGGVILPPAVGMRPMRW